MTASFTFDCPIASGATVGLLLTGFTSQKQKLEIVYTEEFYNDPVNMASRIEMEIQSQFIQVDSKYSSLIIIIAPGSSDLFLPPPDSR